MNYLDDSSATLTEDFDYDAVSRSLGENDSVPRSDHLEAACAVSNRVFKWVYQPPCRDVDGFVCRSIVACWVFVPQLRDLSMTEMAGRFGKKKQSLGRWMDDFKKEFTELNHLRHTRT